jgi:hypothetical protein
MNPYMSYQMVQAERSGVERAARRAPDRRDAQLGQMAAARYQLSRGISRPAKAVRAVAWPRRPRRAVPRRAGV